MSFCITFNWIIYSVYSERMWQRILTCGSGIVWRTNFDLVVWRTPQSVTLYRGWPQKYILNSLSSFLKNLVLFLLNISTWILSIQFEKCYRKCFIWDWRNSRNYKLSLLPSEDWTEEFAYRPEDTSQLLQWGELGWTRPADSPVLPIQSYFYYSHWNSTLKTQQSQFASFPWFHG